MILKRAYWMLILAAALIVAFLMLQWLTAPTQSVRELDYKTFINYLESGRIQTFDAVGLDVHGTLTDGSSYATEIPNRDTVLAREIVKHVRGTVRFESGTSNGMLNGILTFSPFAFTLVILGFILRSARRRPPD